METGNSNYTGSDVNQYGNDIWTKWILLEQDNLQTGYPSHQFIAMKRKVFY
jgi:hypothetical protein